MGNGMQRNGGDLQKVLVAYGFVQEQVSIIPHGNGLINGTWKVTVNGREYILQKLNTSVFKNPRLIADNIIAIEAFLAASKSAYLFIAPLPTQSGDQLFCLNGEYYRLFPFVTGSIVKKVVATPQQAFEAARQFALFTRSLSGMDATQLNITIPDFHNLPMRYKQFVDAVDHGAVKRGLASTVVEYLLSQQRIVDTYSKITARPDFKIRVTHHDTKISNVLFDEHDKGICVIDLDTVMPGHFISDAGDMMRTYLSPVSEEERDVSKIEVREDYYHAIVNGYLSEMGDELTAIEKDHFFFSGEFMMYMQALRFMTDHLMGDVYYGAAYKGHNLNRANNQAVLLQEFQKKKTELVAEPESLIK